jgi:DNA-binding NtrC family response regulator
MRPPTPETLLSWLDSPQRLVVLADLLERGPLTLRELVVGSGRHEQDVLGCLEPPIRSGVVVREGEAFQLAPDLAPPLRTALEAGVAARRERLEPERFVRARVLRGMIGVDPRMQLVFEAIRQVCRLDVPVLVTGETGTGKELVARAIHELGGRRGGPFEAVNCATVPAPLFESHLFGHARGAFTGADRDHVGIVERCHGGTLLLDELGELEPANQAKLLRVLQDRTFRRIGENVTRESSFRLVCATHRDLSAMVANGGFREDLYYRCNVFAIRVPSLRERADDIAYIADDLLDGATARLGLSAPPAISPDAMVVLRAHRWPGNVRELENTLLRAAISAGGKTIEPKHLPKVLVARASLVPKAIQPTRTLAEVERAHILAVFEAHGRHVEKAAVALGIGRASLYRRLREYGVAPTPRK